MDWGAFAKDYGWPLASLAIVLTTGVAKLWYFGPVVKERDVQWERLLSAKDREIERLERIAAQDGKTAQESLELVKDTKETVARIEAQLAKRRGG